MALVRFGNSERTDDQTYKRDTGQDAVRIELRVCQYSIVKFWEVTLSEWFLIREELEPEKL